MDRIGRFEIQAEIGRGGFGCVYRAFDPKVGRVVALKVLNPSEDPSTLTRFRNEATAAGSLHHKNIVTVFECGDYDGTPYLVMEYLDGEDLSRICKRQAPLSLYQKVDTMRQIGQGLHYAHSNGVLHRDVKPANIILLKDGNVKLLDFGIARLLREESTRLTQQGFLMGTVLYMSPETLLEGSSDVLSDIWAYGVIFYELLAGRNPFESNTARSEMLRITTEDPPPLPLDVCPESLQTVLRKLLSKERELRWQSLEDVLFEIEPILIDLKRTEAVKLIPVAERFYQESKWDEAQQVIRGILDMDPESKTGRLLRERVQRELNRPRIQSLIDRAEQEAAQRHFSEAIQLFEAARQLDADDSSIRQRLEDLGKAKQKSQVAGNLLLNARQELKNKSLTGAIQYASEALTVDPGNPDAARLLRELQRENETRDKARQLQECLRKARGLIAMEDLDGAISTLTQGDQENREIKELLTRALALRSEKERRQEYSNGLESAKGLLRANQLTEAVAVLERLARDFAGEAEPGDLLAYARQELRDRERTEAVEHLKESAGALIRDRKFDEASALVRDGLRIFPGEAELSRLLRSVLAEKKIHDEEQALKSALERCKEMRAAGRLSEAFALIAGLLKGHPNHPALLEQSRQLKLEQERKDRDLAVGKLIDKFQTLLQQGRPDAALDVLNAGLNSFPDEPRIEALRPQIAAEQDRRKRQYIAAQLAAAKELGDRNQWSASLEVIRQALALHPDSPELAQAQKNIEAAIKRADIEQRERLEREREAERESLIDRGSQALGEGRLKDAETLLATALQPFAAHTRVIALAAAIELEGARRAELFKQEEEQRKKISDWLRSLKELEDAANWTAAFDLLRVARRECPEDPKLRQAELRVEEKQREAKRKEQLAEEARNIERLVAAVRTSLREGKLGEAEEAFRAELAQFSDHSSVRAVAAELARERSRRIEAAKSEEAKRSFIADQLLKAKNCGDRRDYPGALAIVKAAQRTYPAEPELIEAERELRRAQEDFDHERKKAAALAGIQAEMNRGAWDEAIARAQKAEVEFQGDPSFAKCLDQARRGRDKEIEDLVARAWRVLKAGQLDEAELILRKELRPYSKEEAVLSLVAAMEAERLTREITAGARRHIAARRYKEAEDAIEHLAVRSASSESIAELRAALGAEQERERKEGMYRESRVEADGLLRRKLYQEAIDRYEYLLTQFPKDVQLEQDLVAAIAARERQERLEKIGAEIKRLEEFRRMGDAETVRAGSLALLQSQEDPRARELLAWAEAKLAGPQKVQTGWQGRRLALVAAGLVAVVALGGAWMYVSRPPPKIVETAVTKPPVGSTDPPKPVIKEEHPVVKEENPLTIKPPKPAPPKENAPAREQPPPNIEPKKKPIDTKTTEVATISAPPPVVDHPIQQQPKTEPTLPREIPKPVQPPPPEPATVDIFESPYGSLSWPGPLGANESRTIKGPGGRPIKVTEVSPKFVNAEAQANGQIVVRNTSPNPVQSIRIKWERK